MTSIGSQFIPHPASLVNGRTQPSLCKYCMVRTGAKVLEAEGSNLVFPASCWWQFGVQKKWREARKVGWVERLHHNGGDSSDSREMVYLFLPTNILLV